MDRSQPCRTSCELAASQINRGSKDSTASIVSTTTAAKKNQSRPRFHRHQWLELDQRRGEGVDEHVDHRPASDELDHPVQPEALTDCS